MNYGGSILIATEKRKRKRNKKIDSVAVIRLALEDIEKNKQKILLVAVL